MQKSKAQPRKRLQYIYDLAKVKSICEGGDSVDKKFDPTAQELQEDGEKQVCLSAHVFMYMCVVCIRLTVCLSAIAY